MAVIRISIVIEFFQRGMFRQNALHCETPNTRECSSRRTLQRDRHAAHEAFLLREIGATDWHCPNGSRIELCWDERNLTSLIVVTHGDREGA
jgi:hypothetical protein